MAPPPALDGEADVRTFLGPPRFTSNSSADLNPLVGDAEAEIHRDLGLVLVGLAAVVPVVEVLCRVSVAELRPDDRRD
jgi:hypothetical protein